MCLLMLLLKCRKQTFSASKVHARWLFSFLAWILTTSASSSNHEPYVTSVLNNVWAATTCWLVVVILFHHSAALLAITNCFTVYCHCDVSNNWQTLSHAKMSAVAQRHSSVKINGSTLVMPTSQMKTWYAWLGSHMSPLLDGPGSASSSLTCTAQPWSLGIVACRNIPRGVKLWRQLCSLLGAPPHDDEDDDDDYCKPWHYIHCAAG